MDRRAFLAKAGVGMAAALVSPAVIPFGVISDPATTSRMLTTERLMPTPLSEKYHIWQSVDWFDMVPGDIIRATGYHDGHVEHWQIAGLPHCGNNGNLPGVEISYSRDVPA